MASAFWWASLTVSKLLSTELSLLSLPRALLLMGWAVASWDLAVVPNIFPSFCPWWSSKEDATSSISSSSLVGILVASAAYKLLRRVTGSLLSSFGGLQAEWQICPPLGSALATLSVAMVDCLLSLLLPFLCSVLKYFIQHYQAVGDVLLPPGLAFEKQFHIHYSICFSDYLPSWAAHPLVARALSFLLPYLFTINL